MIDCAEPRNESNRARSRLSILVSLQQDGYAAVIVADEVHRLTENGIALAAKARRSGGPLLAMTATPQEWMRAFLVPTRHLAARLLSAQSLLLRANRIVEAMPEISFWGPAYFQGRFLLVSGGAVLPE